ncbi:hypothetical protein BSU04_26945 [Caballeronia sordidicola]|uniref:Uncharacterized protein n=1 Tax=Caballeronia sordidicola TaxID=196367 RepID=A0A226WXB0_CABSO|nr:hypothetical protein BSU04_26945 [Caballeronia sordidicola]
MSFTNELPGDNDAQAFERTVIVRFGPIERAYNGGDGTHWTVDFKKDLSANIFG